ncbi:hypothetical protein Pyn_09148 [Prunus yedoensis var. nudiflora]|uniref:Uncharacterized protein n=1 Tax=Prunus yedoensis var. nudiflora TaxID=2094558 RepID=A0A314UZE0_PRUYE|nr:hypothetical protein Pyn_09148 [Prunus yedoensis var. nudiflora]
MLIGCDKEWKELLWRQMWFMAPKRTRGMSMEELLPLSPLRRKKGKHQARTSQQRSLSSSQPLVNSSRQPTSSVQSEQASVVRRQRAQLETQLSQQNVVASGMTI